MDKLTDQKYLVTSQYRTKSNLETRLEFHRIYGSNPISWFKWVFDQFDLPTQAYLMELGCGNGALWQENKERIPPQWEFVISDLSYAMLKEAKKNLDFISGRTTFQVLDAQILKYAADEFDAVIANHMLYHVPNIPRTILEIHRVLKRGGKFYAATNGQNHMQKLRDILLSFEPLNKLLPQDSYFRSNNLSFTLENGREYLLTRFADIEKRIYDDQILLTSTEPLIKYIRTIEPEFLDCLSEEQKKEFENYLQKFLTNHDDKIIIQKSTGMFIAQK